jgi:hypothetical protein
MCVRIVDFQAFGFGGLQLLFIRRNEGQRWQA